MSGLSQLDAATGRAVVTCSPFFVNNLADGSTFNVQAAATCPAKSMVYDGFGRVDESDGRSRAGDARSRIRQRLFPRRCKTPAAGVRRASTVVVSDGHGRVVQRVDNLKTPADIIATTYSYLATDELQAIVQDAHLQETDSYSRSMSYDTLGRRVSTYEPNGSGDHHHCRRRRGRCVFRLLASPYELRVTMISEKEAIDLVTRYIDEQCRAIPGWGCDRSRIR